MSDAIYNPYSAITIIFNIAVDQNINFIRHYKNLDNKFTHVDDCYNFYSHECKTAASEKIRRTDTADMDILWTIPRDKQIIELSCVLQKSMLPDIEQGHKIQTGRLSNITLDYVLAYLKYRH